MDRLNDWGIMANKVLIVDDDVLMRRSLAFNFEKSGFASFTAENAEDAIAAIQIDEPDVILLDIGLPGMDGLDAIGEIQKKSEIPVIFLTARRSGEDQITGLNAGADDYITKPFEFDVLLARVKAVLRRKERLIPAYDQSNIQVGGLFMDLEQHEAKMDGKNLELSPKEFDLLAALALEADRVISTDNLLKRVWGAEYSGEPQVLYVHIRWLRGKVEKDPDNPKHITTVRGVGYKYISNPE